MELPLAPTWLPTWVIVVNTILLEAVLGLALYWYVVRRSDRFRRALAIFAASLFTVGAAQTTAMTDAFADPRYGETRFDRLGAHGDATFDVGWTRSRVFGRLRIRRVAIYVDRHPADHVVGDWVMIARAPYRGTKGWMPNRTWFVDPGLVDSFSPFVDRPGTPETNAAVWRILTESALATTSSTIAAVVSDA